jgi:hypothetical protein
MQKKLAPPLNRIRLEIIRPAAGIALKVWSEHPVNHNTVGAE